MRLGPAHAFAVLVAAVTCSCSVLGSDPQSGTTSTGTDGSSGGESSSSSSGAVDTTGAGSTSLVWPPDDGITQCIRTCEGPFDCCPAGSAGTCPGPYPGNVDCIDGLCVPGQCESDGDCPESDPPQACRLVDGLRACVTLCDADPDVCLQPDTGLACSGQTDEGEGYCFESCESPNVFCGNQTCDPESGRCVCADNGQCVNGSLCL